MRLDSQCILCLLKRHADTAAKLGSEEQVTAFTRDLMRILCDGPVEMAAPYYTPDIAKLFTEHFGLADDRFTEEKELSNRFCMERLDRISGMVRSADDPLYAGLQGAILGNYIDFSALQGEVSFEKLDEMLDLLHTIEVDRAVFDKLRADLEGGKELLYLTDNAGEIVFDRVWLEVIRDLFPNLAITVCVRGGPAQNDATIADAEEIGMPFRVIDNGTCISGTVLEKASDELRAAMERADVVISKGQANVETLLDTGHGYNIYYAFLVKCKRFIDRFGKEKLTPMLVRERDL
jgi:uncharacterized protein with ATP-grasp and redox domains